MLARLCREPAPGLDGVSPPHFSSRLASCGIIIVALATEIVDITPSFTEPREASMSVDISKKKTPLDFAKENAVATRSHELHSARFF
jgi:hypothetical protein